MKRKSLLLGFFCAMSGMSMYAQQLPNVGFENWKTTAGSTDTYGNRNTNVTKRVRPGFEPIDWNGSSVNQNVGIGGDVKDQLVIRESGFGGGFCAKLQNKKVGAFGFGDEAPGYITLGTPWVYAEINMNVCDGGTYGGVNFTNTPDAVTGQFQRKDNNAETSTVIAYLWNGTFTSKIGKLNDAKISENNVDRAILNKLNNSGGVTGNGKLVASINQSISLQEISGGWTEVELPFTYVDGAGTPTMMNIIVCAGNYWNRTALTDGTILLVDDLKFLYYSRLKALKVNGISIPNFSEDVYEYDMQGAILPSVDQISYEKMGQASTVKITRDIQNSTVSLEVSNAQGADKDGKNVHTYLLRYGKPAKYNGFLDIAGTIIDGQSVYIDYANDGKSCSFALYDFSLDEPNSLGDIIIDNVQIAFDETGEYRNFTGRKEGINLADGAIVADADLTGWEHFYGGHLEMDINVEWIIDPTDPESERSPIPVKFNGGIDSTSGIGTLQNGNAVAYGQDGFVSVNGFEGNAQVYAMDGRMVDSVYVNGEAQISLAKGLYIVRLGNKALKVIVK